MEIVRKNYNHLVSSLSKKTIIDGRFFVLIALIIYFSLIFISSFFTKYYEFWRYLRVPTMFPAFADMRVITSGFECYRLGYEVLVENPCDPWHRPTNYPRIWMAFAPLGLDQSHTILLGIFFALLFFIMVFLIIRHLNYSEALIYSIALCSPSVMLAVERGNNDLIIFAILSISLLLINKQKPFWRLVSYSAILLAAILKLYPIFAFTVICKEKKKHAYILASFIAGCFGIYVLSALKDIKLISTATEKSNIWSYGYKIIFSLFFRDLEKVLTSNVVNHNNLLFVHAYKSMLFICLALLIFFLIYNLAKVVIKTQFRIIDSFTPQDDNFLEAFRIGSSIYIGTFFLGNNWCYRLVFILFTMPQILYWTKCNVNLRLISVLSIIGILLTLWLKTSMNPYIIYLSQVIDWLLFVYFCYTLLLTLPDWLKSAFSFHISWNASSLHKK